MRRDDALKAKVEAVNAAHAYAQQLYNLLSPILTKLVGQKVEKMDGTLTAKCAALLPELPCTPRLRVIREFDRYSLSWRVYTNAPIGDPSGPHSVCYHEVGVHVGRLKDGVLTEIVPPPTSFRTDYTVQEVQALQLRVEVARNAYHEARHACLPFNEYR